MAHSHAEQGKHHLDVHSATQLRTGSPAAKIHGNQRAPGLPAGLRRLAGLRLALSVFIGPAGDGACCWVVFDGMCALGSSCAAQARAALRTKTPSPGLFGSQAGVTKNAASQLLSVFNE